MGDNTTTITIHDYSFNYVEHGAGEPLLFVHGSASDYRTWKSQLDAFESRHRVIAYSRRYHWPNEPIPDGADYSMIQHVDDLQAILQSLDSVSVHLVGHSYGAFLCLMLAIRDPSLVRTLVLAEPPVITLFVSNTPKPLELLKLLLTRPRTGAAILKFGAKGVVPAEKAFRQDDMQKGIRIFGDAVFGVGSYDRLSASKKEQVQDNLTNVKAELLGSGFAPVDANELRQIQMPTLLVNGEFSISLFQHITDRLEELLPHIKRVVVPGASHAMHEDNAYVYNKAVISFLEEHDEILSSSAAL